MTPGELRDYLLSFTGAEETFPFNPETSVFKVGGKMFALSRLGEESLRVSLKCERRLAEALREAHAAVVPGRVLSVSMPLIGCERGERYRATVAARLGQDRGYEVHARGA